MELSVVISAYDEEESLPELHRRLTTVLAGLDGDCEVIVVDDGSRDRTPELLREICARDRRFRAITLARNFGHQAAVAAGLRYASGRAVVVMDADLQDPPELLPELLERWREGFEVVYAQRLGRHESGAKRAWAYLFYRVLRRLATPEIPPDAGDFCLVDHRVVELLNAMPERNRYVRGLRAWVGFRQTAVGFDRPERFAGPVKYTWRQSLALGINGLLSFSQAPLRLGTYLGLLVSMVSFLLAVAFVIAKLAGGFEIRGWASTIVVILFLGGVQLLTLGVIGEYIGRIYDEVKQRPLYVVRELTNLDPETEAGAGEANRRSRG